MWVVSWCEIVLSISVIFFDMLCFWFQNDMDTLSGIDLDKDSHVANDMIYSNSLSTFHIGHIFNSLFTICISVSWCEIGLPISLVFCDVWYQYGHLISNCSRPVHSTLIFSVDFYREYLCLWFLIWWLMPLSSLESHVRFVVKKKWLPARLPGAWEEGDWIVICHLKSIVCLFEEKMFQTSAHQAKAGLQNNHFLKIVYKLFYYFKSSLNSKFLQLLCLDQYAYEYSIFLSWSNFVSVSFFTTLVLEIRSNFYLSVFYQSIFFNF